ncbi:MAG: hypothetical protein ACFFB1_16200 [Promethearchaeota archaeon]
MSYNENTVTKIQQKNAQKAIDSVINGFQLEPPPNYVIKGLNSNEEIAKLEYKKFGKNGREIKKIDKEIKFIQGYSQNFVKVVFEFKDYFLKRMVYKSDTMKTSMYFTSRYMWTGVLDFPIPSSFIFGRVCKTSKHGGGKYYFAPFESVETEIVKRIEKFKKIMPNFFPYEIIEFDLFIDLFGLMKFSRETMDLLSIMPRKVKYNKKTTALVDYLNQKKDLINIMESIPHFGTGYGVMSKFVSEIDVSTIFIPFKELTYFQIDQFSYPLKKHGRAINSLLNCLEEIYSKKIIVKREDDLKMSQESAEEKPHLEQSILLDEIHVYYYFKENEGKAFTVQALYNRINELKLNEQLKSKMTPNMIEEILTNLVKKGKISSEQKGSEKFYFY